MSFFEEIDNAIFGGFFQGTAAEQNEHASSSSSSSSTIDHSATNNNESNAVKGEEAAITMQPWSNPPTHWNGKEEELKKLLKEIPTRTNLFKVAVPKDFKSEFNQKELSLIALTALQTDPNLSKLRMQLVPMSQSDPQFWKAYFYLVHLVRYDDSSSGQDKLNVLDRLEKELQVIFERKLVSFKQELEFLRDKMSEQQELLERIVVKSMISKQKPSSKEAESGMENLFAMKKKFSFMATELSDNEEVIEAVINIEKPFLHVMELFDKYVEMKEGKKEIKSSDEKFFIPNVIGNKRVPLLSDQQRLDLAKVLPLDKRKRDWTLIYSTFDHGTLWSALMQQLEENGPYILIVQTIKGTLLGAYMATDTVSQKPNSYYGEGETFVFTYKTQGKFRCYPWTRKNKYFIMTYNSLVIGGGSSSKAAIFIDEDLTSGSSGESETFANPPLAETEDFKIYGIEVWGLVFKKSSLY